MITKLKLKIVLFILVMLFNINPIFSGKIPDSVAYIIRDFNDSTKIKTLQSICWDNRFTNPILAISCALESVELSKQIDNNELRAQGLSFIGVVHLQQSNYEDANKYFWEAFEISSKYNLKLQLAYSYNNLSHLRKYLGDIDKAKEYIWKSKSIMEEIRDLRGLGYAYLRLSDIYLETHNYDSALFYAEKTVKIRELIGEKKAIARAKLNVGDALEGLKKFGQALSLYMKLADDIQEPARIDIHIAEAYFGMKDYQNAQKFALKSFNIAKELKLYQQLFDASDILYKVNLKTNNLDQAIYYLELKFDYRDSLTTFSKNNQIEILTYTYESKQKEADNLRLLAESDFKDRLILFTIIAFILVTLALFFMFFMWQKVKQSNTLLSEKNIEIQQQANALHDLNATKDKFFSIIAHDLRNPIGSFKNITEFIHDNYNELEQSEQKEFIQTIYESSKQVYELLENLLEWSRIQRGQIVINPDNFDIALLISNIIHLLTTQADNKNIKLINKVNNFTYIFADTNMISTVIRNLISNAIKFTPNGGNIEINSAEYGESITVLTIKDTGVGMSQDTLDKLFRIDGNIVSSGTNNEKGTGLGLILCKEFLEKNGGNIWAESIVDRGTTFSITLPNKKNS